MISFIKLIRPINLIIIAMTMYAVRFGVMRPLQGQLIFEEWKFALCVLVMILLAASGNIINDYFDIRVDRINKPDKVLVGTKVKRRVAMAGNHIFNILAFLITAYLVWDSRSWYALIVPVFISFILWIYSLILKKRFLIGNLAIAILIGFVPIWATWFENRLFKIHHMNRWIHFNDSFYDYVLIISIFAFLMTLIREVIKDMEDIEGDAKVGYRTMPIVIGIKLTCRYASMLILFLLIGIGFCLYSLGTDINIPIIYYCCSLGLILPLVVSFFKLFKSENKNDFSYLSKILKISMVFGLVLIGIIPLL